MPIERMDFENLSEADLQELVDTQVPEGLRIEYKRELYGSADADKREALKDISAFANAHGGHLLIGIAEQDGLPTGIPGVAGISPDDVMQRLEQLIRSGLEPRVVNARIGAVRLAGGANVFVIRVPQSWNLPHRISAQNTNRFWVRNSTGAHEASMDELRALFTFSSNLLDRVRAFRDKQVGELITGVGGRPIEGSGRFIVHLVPLSAFSSRSEVDLQVVQQNNGLFRPIGSSGWNPQFNFDGFINEMGRDLNQGYTQIFRNGAVEATRAGIVFEHESRGRVIAGPGLEQEFFNVFSNYLTGLRTIGVSPPIVVMITLEGVQGAKYAVYRNSFFYGPDRRIDRALLSLPECIINEYGADIDHHRAVKPAFDALWNSAGYASCQFFDETGAWVGNRDNR